MNRLIALSALLVLASVACSVSAQATITPTSIAKETVPVTNTEPFPVPTGNLSLLAQREMCVTPIGLWLRSSPEFADNNKVLALPQGTRVTIVSVGVWDRIYLPTLDEYGYVRSNYLGECE